MNITVSKERYKVVQAHLWEAIHLKYPEMWVNLGSQRLCKPG